MAGGHSVNLSRHRECYHDVIGAFTCACVCASTGGDQFPEISDYTNVIGIAVACDLLVTLGIARCIINVLTIKITRCKLYNTTN